MLRFPTTHGAVLVALRLVILLSLWQGPLPWGHSHSPQMVDLAEHVACCHGGDAKAFRLGWHWHLSPLQRSSHGAPCHNEPHRPHESHDSTASPMTIAEDGSQAPDASDSAPAPAALLVDVGSTNCTPTPARRGFASGGELRSPRPLRQLYCRLLC